MPKIWFGLAILLASLGLHQNSVRAQDASWKSALGDPSEISRELREEVVQFPLESADSTSPVLTGTIYRPQGSGLFKTIILNHGSPTNPADRLFMGRYRLLPQIGALVREGYAVLVPMRRGYGPSPGPYAEGFGSCNSARFDQTGAESARDIRGAINWLRTQQDIESKSTVLMGQSAGGFASLAVASERIEGVVAVINLSVGRGGNGFTGVPCNVQAMADTLARYGGLSQVPTLWFYVENDKYFGPETAKLWFSAWKKNGGKGRLALHPPHGNDGHLLFYAQDGLALWLRPVIDFLAESGVSPKPKP